MTTVGGKQEWCVRELTRVTGVTGVAGLKGFTGMAGVTGIARRKETCEGEEEMQDKETNKRGTRNDRALASAVLPFLLISRPHLSSSSAF